MIKLQDGQYLGFSPDGHVISKRPDDYDRVFTSENSYYVNGFKTKSGEYYMWDDTQKLYVLGTKTFKGWEETNGAEKSVTGKVAVWKTGINPQCYALYQFIEVKSYASSKFETVKQQTGQLDNGKWQADYVDKADIENCKKLFTQEIEHLNKCTKNYVANNPGSIAFFVNRNTNCLSDLTKEERISMLRVLIEHVKGAGFGGDYDIDNAICRILLTIPTVEEKSEIYNDLKTFELQTGNTLFETVVNDMADGALVVFSKWLTEFIYEKKLYEASTVNKNGNLHSFIYQTKKEVESGSILTRKAFALDLEAEKINGQIKIQPVRRWYSGGMAPVTTYDGDEKLAPVTVAPDEMIVLHFYSDLKYGLETIYKKDATIVIPALALWGIVEEKSERDLSLKLKAAAMILTLPTALEGGWAAAFTLIDELALGSSILIDDTGWRESVKSDAGKTWLKAYDVFITAYFAGRALEALGAFDELKQSFSSWEKVAVETKEAEAVTAKMRQLVKMDEAIAKGTGNLIDDILDAAKSFDDNLLDIADVGFENWKTFQNKVYGQLQTMHPNSKIGSQIYLDVTYIDNAGKTVTKTIIPDNLIQVETNGIKKYKVIDAKTSIKNDLTQMADLTSTCTANQKEIYPLIDNLSSGKIVKVEMYGTEARKIFGPFANQVSKIEIQLELGVDFWVNVNKTDFSKYIIRNRVK